MFPRALARVLAICFVVTALAALVLVNIELHAFEPATYRRALFHENFYQKFPILLSDLLKKNLGSRAPVFLQRLSILEWRRLITDLISEKQLQDMTEDSLNQFFAYLNGETLSPKISLVVLKQNVAGPAGLSFILTLIQSQPDCSLQELGRIFLRIGSGELCNPPTLLLDLLQPVIQSELPVFASAIPDELPLLPNANDPSILSKLKLLNLARLIIRLSPLLPISLLLAVTILVVRTLRSWLIWWGWPLLLTGLPGIFIGFQGAPFLRTLIERLLFNNLAATLPLEIVNSIRSIVDTSLRELLKAVGWEALGLSSIGLAMILGEAFLAHRHKKRISASEARTQIF